MWPAILEAAIRAEPVVFNEAAFRGAHQMRRRGKIADSRRIDDGRTGCQLVPARRGGRMPPLDLARQFGGLRRGVGDQRVDQGGFAHAGLADQQRDAARERLLDAGYSRTGLRGRFDAGQIQAAIRS